jgi:hypothetical protein
MFTADISVIVTDCAADAGALQVPDEAITQKILSSVNGFTV